MKVGQKRSKEQYAGWKSKRAQIAGREGLVRASDLATQLRVAFPGARGITTALVERWAPASEWHHFADSGGRVRRENWFEPVTKEDVEELQERQRTGRGYSRLVDIANQMSQGMPHERVGSFLTAVAGKQTAKNNPNHPKARSAPGGWRTFRSPAGPHFRPQPRSGSRWVGADHSGSVRVSRRGRRAHCREHGRSPWKGVVRLLAHGNARCGCRGRYGVPESRCGHASCRGGLLQEVVVKGGWKMRKVGNVRHWWHVDARDGHVVVVEPYTSWGMWQILHFPLGKGQEHFSNAHSAKEAFETGKRALAYYNGKAPNRMGKMHGERKNPVSRTRSNPDVWWTEAELLDFLKSHPSGITVKELVWAGRGGLHQPHTRKLDSMVKRGVLVRERWAKGGDHYKLAVKSNPVAVSFRPTHYGLGAYVNGRCVDNAAMSFEQAEEAAFDHLVGVLGIDRIAASRLVRRATRQEAKREGARHTAAQKRYRS